jgi:hypothetical protein
MRICSSPPARKSAWIICGSGSLPDPTKKKSGWTLLKKQFFERSELVQDWSPDSFRQFFYEPFESLNDVQQRGLIHFRSKN